MLCRRLSIFIAIFCLCAVIRSPHPANADDWQPINPAELSMTGVPEAPGAAAVILYRQVDRDDTTDREYNYVRIKILTEEGRKYANVEIPFFRESEDVHGLKARTIRPDGTIANF